MLSRALIRIFAASVLTLSSASLFAEDNRPDFDRDDDGLIEVNDLADLDEIRNSLDGTSLYGKSEGCPETGCNGFELTTDLDFDTNGDGVIDSQDTYWNDGQGWLPIATGYNKYFSANFNGNGYAIKNLYIDRPTTSNIGLFSKTRGADVTRIEKLAFIGSLTKIQGATYVGSISGTVISATISEIYTTGKLSGTSRVGGLIGIGHYLSVNNVFSSSATSGISYIAGVIGELRYTAASNILSTGFVSSDQSWSSGAIIGNSFETETSATYWSRNSSGKETGTGSETEFRSSLSELQCPISESDETCISEKVLYQGWDPTVWDFGTSEQLPALNIDGKLYRDSDGDGVSDDEDSFVYDRTASIDSDNDGYPDSPSPGCGPSCQDESPLIYDRFPDNNAAGEDLDGDGLPDQWASLCDAVCQTTSGLTLDEHPGDHDNDEIPDDVDNDDNNDGIIDADADSDGLIDIASLEELNAVRYETTGNGQKLSEASTADSSGCPRIYYDSRCRGYELTQTLDFDTNSDGVMNESDEYWNEGEGWLPLFRLESEFNGNGYAIRNLYINRPSTNSIGLFTSLSSQSWVHDLVLTGPLVYISGRNDTGTLAGSSGNTTIERVLVNTHIDGEGIWTGGVVGDSSSTEFSDIFVSGNVYGPWIVGGISGGAASSVFRNSVSSTYIDGGQVTGGLYSYGENNETIASYFAADLVRLKTAIEGGYTPIESDIYLKDLRCPTTHTNTSCSSENILYDQWNSEIWNFGSRIQLPSMVLKNASYSDSDGDGILDPEDAFATIHAAAIDRDNDSYPDRFTEGCDLNCIVSSGLTLDKFPHHPEASIDDDNDGYPDKWSSGCDTNCQADSPLELDPYPGDIDNDGIPDEQVLAENPEGLADSDSDGLIEIYTLRQLNAIRYQLNGYSRKLSETAEPDSSGCPVQVIGGIPQARCHGYELMTDLDFDTNNSNDFDSGDEFWNDGRGWSPIGQENDYFRGVLEGNGHVIRNLNINRPDEFSALFFAIDGYESSVTNLAITGSHVSVHGLQASLLAAGIVNGASVSNIFITGNVSSEVEASSLLTTILFDGHINNVFIGGLVSRVSTGSSSNRTLVHEVLSGSISHVISTASSTGSLTFGMTGGSAPETEFYSLYQLEAPTLALTEREQALDINIHSLTELQCPTGPDNTTCVEGTTMYEGWDTEVWDFGSSSQLPGMRFANGILRDSDGDGIPDENNAPEITLTLTQDGNEEEEIITGMGDVTISAIVTDIDESDTHELVWSLEGVHNSYKLGNSVTFNPDTLPEGEYRMAVTVTDNGYPSMSATAEIITRVIAGVQAPVAAPPPAETGGSGAGSIYFWWMLMFGGLLYANRRQAM
ncbi:hypothetical protein [uncultured Thalassolituus sp.]|uniref:hypothetical protein n=1 Tax=uncultured Thalassolituus sp. TaxID=285273 RepID=UPI00260A1ABC|nr:hypothetical protein [uncultured Thalassolituus sp.]